jgi:hypothetical protein
MLTKPRDNAHLYTLLHNLGLSALTSNLTISVMSAKPDIVNVVFGRSANYTSVPTWMVRHHGHSVVMLLLANSDFDHRL